MVQNYRILVEANKAGVMPLDAVPASVRHQLAVFDEDGDGVIEA